MNKLFRVNFYFQNIAIISLIAIFFGLDRYLKHLALSLKIGESYPLISNFFSFSFARNYKIAFSLPISSEVLLPLITLAIILLLSALIRELYIHKSFTLTAAALTFIFFGAISNMLDRFQYGYVIDYLNLKNFSIFNLADVMIALSSLFYIFLYYKLNKEKSEHNQSKKVNKRSF